MSLSRHSPQELAHPVAISFYSMRFNKKRLYIALYPTGTAHKGERRYHWAFLIGPNEGSKDAQPGTKHHVKNSPLGWSYEEISVEDVQAATNLLARIAIAKIEDEQRLIALFRRVPVIQGNPDWRCRSWIMDAVTGIAQDGMCVGTAELDWETIEECARQYVAQKIDGGRYKSAADMAKAKPTWDML